MQPLQDVPGAMIIGTETFPEPQHYHGPLDRNRECKRLLLNNILPQYHLF